MSFDRRRCGRETRWRERERKWKRKAGGSRKHKGFPLHFHFEAWDVSSTCHLSLARNARRRSTTTPTLSCFERGDISATPPAPPHSKRETEVNHHPTLLRFERGDISAAHHPLPREIESTTTTPCRVLSEGVFSLETRVGGAPTCPPSCISSDGGLCSCHKAIARLKCESEGALHLAF